MSLLFSLTDPTDMQEFRCNATNLAVRDLLLQVRAAVVDCGASEDEASSVEIALAEALNNVVEHALPGQSGAMIAVRLTRSLSYIVVEIEDPGHPLPGFCVAGSTMADVNVGIEDLPEGGFGWGLIHAVTDEIAYQRIDGVNFLKLRFKQ